MRSVFPDSVGRGRTLVPDGVTHPVGRGLGWRIASSAVIYAASNVLVGLVPLILLPVLTRLLTPAEYGIVAMFAVFVQVTTALTGLSVQGAVGMRYFERERLDFPLYVSSCLLVLSASTIVVLLIVAALGHLLFRVTEVPTLWLMAGVVAAGAGFVTQVRLTIWQSAKQPMPFAALRAFQSATDLGLSLLFVLALGLTWQGRVSAMAFAAVGAGLIALLLLARAGLLRPAYLRTYVVDALRFGLPLVPHAIGGMLVTVADRFLITNLLDVASTGIYLVSVQMGLVVYLVTDAVNRALSPWLIEGFKENSESRDRRITRLLALYFAALLIFGALVGVAAGSAVKFIAGTGYEAASGILIYIALGYAVGGIYLVLSNSIFWAGATGRLAIITLSSGLFNVALSFVLIRAFGLAGAGQAFLLGQIALCAGAWWLAQRSRPLPWLSLLPR